MSGGDDGDPDRLVRLLGEQDLAWLVARVRRRLELGREIAGVVTLSGATEAQRGALARLLGRRPRPGGGLGVRLEDVDAVLRTSGAWPAGLAGAVVALTGPVTVRAAAAQRRAWQAAWAPVEAALAARPDLLGWWRGEVDSGLPRRLAASPAAGAVLARDLVAVLERLPAPGVAIGALAHAATGSAHGLDAGALATLALRAARVVAGLPPAPPSRPSSRSRSASGDRETWAAVGVVWTCENPVVLAAVADAWAERATTGPPPATAPPPVVCTAGQPSVAVTAVLRGLADAGWTLLHHGDLDPDGVRITNRLVGDLGAVPWRMGVGDYEAALAAGLGRSSGRAPVAAVWDERLGPAMARSGRVVEEEAVLDALVADVLPAALPAGGAAGTGGWTGGWTGDGDGLDGS